MTDENKTTFESVNLHDNKTELTSDFPDSDGKIFENSKSSYSLQIRKSFFLIETKLDAAKAVWRGFSELQPDQDKVLILFNELIEYCKTFSTYTCNPFNSNMRKRPSKIRTSYWILQAAFERDKSKAITPFPPLSSYWHVIVEIHSIRSLIFSLEQHNDSTEEYVVTLLSNLIDHTKRVKQEMKTLWDENFPESKANES